MPDGPMKPITQADSGTGRINRNVTEINALCRRLVGLAVKLIWNRHDAEEIAQEAMKLAVMQRIDINDARALPWLLRTTANLCLNRRRRRRPEPLDPWVDRPAGESPLQTAERIEQLERLRKAIETLPPQQRTALVLRTMEQMEYEAIAEAMEITVAAVRTHVHAARRRLAEWFEANE